MREFRQQLVSALLVIVTVAAVIAAAINFQQQSRFALPDDGVAWTDQTQGDSDRVVAAYVTPGSPALKAGLRTGDVLLSIEGVRMDNALKATEVLARLGPWRQADYEVQRGGSKFTAKVIIGQAERDSTVFYQYAVAVVYLAIGLFVYFRRGNAPRALHFFLLCLASFIMSSFHYSGKLNNFDKVIYLGNVVAGYLAPTLFLHFCCVFPEPQKWIRRRGAAVALYLPGLALLAFHLGIMFGYVRTAAPLLEMRWMLDRIWLTFLCTMYLLGGVVLAWQLRRADDPVVRRQLTWLRNGTVIGMLPFALIYAVPYLMGVPPNHAMNLAVLPMAFIPLTWAYAILRYRLMDVAVIFQEGYVYTLATLAVLSIFYGLIFTVSRAGELSGTAMVALILIAAFVFQPIRNWIQEQLDRHYFYKDRYDYRRTLIEFARELGSPANLGEMLESVADRLIRTLGIRHVAFFVWEEADAKFRLELASNRRGRQTENVPYGLDMSFLSANPKKPYLFFERTRNLLDVVSHEMPVSARRSIAELELTYYLPCSARGRTIAYLGVSRTETGDFLSSEDVELLVTLSGYVGIAVDNSMLYQSLARKVEEYEKLKEFSENIVESINVGILAADLEDRVESWNSQIEKLTGISRERALGRKLSELLPTELCERLGPGVDNVYKFVLKPDVTLNIAVAPLLSREGAQIGRLIIFDDVTDRAELERRLMQADKLSSIGLLAAGVAHEVNTPLAVISTYAQMLAKQISGDEQKAPLLEKIARQTFRASEIVNSLLNFSRTSPTEFVSVDLNKVVKETLALMEHQLTKSGITATLTLDEKLPRIKGSPGKLQQVFLNLFLNARDAMERGGVLAVKTWAHDGRVVVTVADSGAGIARENLEKIFDPFFTTKGAKKGTGLGLSVSYGIVREHAGNIEVQSEIGTGTRFELSFPEAVVMKRSESPAIEKPAAAVAQAVSTQVISTQVISTQAGPQPAVASQNDRLIC
ncbi:MAG TPA: ATP-binding protein [Bryobacteraceae bacterium]|jgi:two-component system NtrC family sensor kinase|nr:ATP-binding protein [Bryobacteraceae bacterium]